ncbi:uncharacterized protein LOC130665854 [Microplitis mediator]|uniref:uncharacterized protein LOC130665854 n=1 Tax=Microplitis mediator TaxID=375433 RepID=UPI00255302D1|nr:uncharacterized protein LOC130665854 [Microplitis mediator]
MTTTEFNDIVRRKINQLVLLAKDSTVVREIKSQCRQRAQKSREKRKSESTNPTQTAKKSKTTSDKMTTETDELLKEVEDVLKSHKSIIKEGSGESSDEPSSSKLNTPEKIEEVTSNCEDTKQLSFEPNKSEGASSAEKLHQESTDNNI